MMYVILVEVLFFCCRSKIILDSCFYLLILVFYWYFQQINGYKFEGKEGDYIRISERLLDVQDVEIMIGKSICEFVQFIEYSSQQWFIIGNGFFVLRNKVIYYQEKFGWNLIFFQQIYFLECICLIRFVVSVLYGEIIMSYVLFL